jgi:ABC-type Fe3+-hydroxamate transport system substrate-binding protein
MRKALLKIRFGAALTLALLLWPTSDFARMVKDQTGRNVNVPDHPHRLVSLAPSVTETLFALGFGDRLVGDTDYCDYPPQAKALPHVGGTQNPSLEAIAALKPDLVLGTNEANRRETAAQLDHLGIPLYGVTAHTVDGTIQSVEELGRALGWDEAAQTLVASLRARTAAVDRRVRDEPRLKVLFVVQYHPLIAAGRETFISDVIYRAGGASISADMPSDWPRMGLESVLSRAPDVILVPRTEAFAPDISEFQTLPGWRDLAAVKNHRIYFVSESIMHPSPRLIDALEEVANILHPVEKPASNSR